MSSSHGGEMGLDPISTNNDTINITDDEINDSSILESKIGERLHSLENTFTLKALIFIFAKTKLIVQLRLLCYRKKRRSHKPKKRRKLTKL
jgi:hypothetical protein